MHNSFVKLKLNNWEGFSELMSAAKFGSFSARSSRKARIGWPDNSEQERERSKSIVYAAKRRSWRNGVVRGDPSSTGMRFPPVSILSARPLPQICWFKDPKITIQLRFRVSFCVKALMDYRCSPFQFWPLHPSVYYLSSRSKTVYASIFPSAAAPLKCAGCPFSSSLAI